MKKIAFVFAAALVALVSCNKETADVKEQGITRTFGVQFVETKVEFGDESGSTINVKWANGDEVAVQLSDDSVHKGTVSVSGTTSYLSVSGLTAAQEALDVTDAWYPYSATAPTAETKVPGTQTYGKLPIPVKMTAYNAGTLTFGFDDTYGWSVVRIPVKKGNADRTLKFIKFKNNNGDAKPDLIQLNTTEALTDDVKYFDIVVPAAETKPAELIFADSNNNEYRRKKAANKTLAAGKVYKWDTEDAIDDTGKYTWIFKGEDGPAGNELSQNAPFTYWFPFYSSAANFGDITRGADYWTENPNVSGSKNNFYFAITANIGGQGKSSSEWGSVAESKTTINGAANQVMRFPIHTGNYPILGFKVTKLDLLGTGMKVRLDVNSTQDTSAPGTNTYVGRYMPVRYTGAAENRHQTLSEDGEAGTGVYYIDLSASNVQFKNNTTNVNETLPNTRTLHFTTFNLQFRDIVPGTAGTMDIYWIGFFNSKSELETFAAAH